MLLSLARCDLSWVEPNHRVKWLIYHVIKSYSQKASPVSQRQWPKILVGLWVRVKGPHRHFQVTCRSRDHVLFEKRHESTNARPQNSAGNIKYRKTLITIAFFLFKIYLSCLGKYFSLLFLLYLFWYSVRTLSMNIKIINSDSPV